MKHREFITAPSGPALPPRVGAQQAHTLADVQWL
jgi:hypothetical protein